MAVSILFGVGTALASLGIRWRVPAVPHSVAYGGIAAGVSLMGLSFVPALGDAGAVLLAAAIGLGVSAAQGMLWPPAPDTRYQDLAEFTERAALIQKRYLGTHDGSEIMEAQARWAAEVCAYLRDHVGKGQANRFEFADATQHAGPVGYDLLGQGQYALIIARRRALHDIMAAL